MTIGLISARGGSVRLPRKNIKEFCGHPLVAWTIRQMFYSKLVDYIIFTTDDQEIFHVFEKYIPKGMENKCHNILRPVWDNDTCINRPYLHAIETVQAQGMKIDEDDAILTLFATSPQRFPGDVDNLIQAYYDKENCQQMCWFAPDRETFVYKNQRPMQSRYGISYKVKPVICDKFWNYSIMAGGNSIGRASSYIENWRKNGFSDREIDAKNTWETDAAPDAFSVYPFQGIECDYDHWFSVVEAVMEKMILKGRGIEIYQDYYEGHI